MVHCATPYTSHRYTADLVHRLWHRYQNSSVGEVGAFYDQDYKNQTECFTGSVPNIVHDEMGAPTIAMVEQEVCRHDIEGKVCCPEPHTVHYPRIPHRVPSLGALLIWCTVCVSQVVTVLEFYGLGKEGEVMGSVGACIGLLAAITFLFATCGACAVSHVRFNKR